MSSSQTPAATTPLQAGRFNPRREYFGLTHHLNRQLCPMDDRLYLYAIGQRVWHRTHEGTIWGAWRGAWKTVLGRRAYFDQSGYLRTSYLLEGQQYWLGSCVIRSNPVEY